MQQGRLVLKEKRREQRMPIVRSVTYSDDRYSFSQMIPTTTVDVSRSGACFYTHRPFSVGENLIVSSQAFGNVVRPAQVCWSCKSQGGEYKVGITFT